MRKRKHSGFSLIEIIVALGVFLLFAVGIYSGIQFTFKAVYQSRLRILETGILSEQIEIIRNLPFADVGIVNGSPSGVLLRTVTTTRSGIDFAITRTIRNVDDPFDGTIGGAPNDTAPADYKLVEAEIICTRCEQRQPARLATYVGPKYLEGNRWNGALFISVFDAAARPVPGATVTVAATSTSSTVNLTDLTNNQGRLNLVDLPAGIGAYHIMVTKPGYTTDQTRPASASLPNPVKPPASVVAQNVTAISFEIDQVSRIDLVTKTGSCQNVGGVPVSLRGTKLIGANPDTYLLNQNITTNAQGSYRFSNLVWDAYGLRPSGYDLIGAIPVLPVSVGPNVNQDVDLILGPDTPYSLLVNVTDSVTGQPLSNAMVVATSTGFSARQQTGLGFISQTDWSGGDGQLAMANPTRYWSDDGRVSVDSPAGDIALRQVGSHYMRNGELESSIFDLGAAANLVNLTWQPQAQPPPTGPTPARLKLATSNTSTPASWNYLGPDGTANTYYNPATPVVNSVHNGDRYLRYRVFLATDTPTSTPTLSDVSVSYTSSCTPPGQAYFGNLSNQPYSVQTSRTGYQTRIDIITVDGDAGLSVDLVSS